MVPYYVPMGDLCHILSPVDWFRIRSSVSFLIWHLGPFLHKTCFPFYGVVENIHSSGNEHFQSLSTNSTHCWRRSRRLWGTLPISKDSFGLCPYTRTAPNSNSASTNLSSFDLKRKPRGWVGWGHFFLPSLGGFVLSEGWSQAWSLQAGTVK